MLLAALAVGCIDPGDDTSSTETLSETTGTMDSSAGPTSHDTSSESDSEPSGTDSTGSTTTDTTDTNVTDVCEPMCVGDMWEGCGVDPEPCEFGCDDQAGCLPVCTPGQVECDGDNVIECSEDGVPTLVEVCDPLMGFACEGGACTGPCEANALTETNEGCDFYPTVTANILGSDGFRFTVRVANPGNEPATVSIHRGDDEVEIENPEIAPDEVLTIELPWVPALQATDDWSSSRVVADGAYRLRADRPVVVYQYNAEGGGEGADSAESNDASVLLPAHTLENDYTVVSTQSWPDPNSQILLPGFYTVTAIDDGTQVTLTTPDSVVARPGDGVNLDGSGVVSLDAGDVLEVFSSGTHNNPGDLSGTNIHATKPVQVIGGHMCSGVPTVGDNTCNHLEETLLPRTWLGNEYVVVPPATGGAVDNPRDQEVYILAMEDGTDIVVSPDIGVWPNVKAGQKIVVPLTDKAMVVTGTKPVSVTQVMASPGAGDSGGPSMLQIHPTPNWFTHYEFVLPEGYDDVYVNILVRSDSQPKVNLQRGGEDEDTVIDSGYTQLENNFWYQRYKLETADVHKVLLLGSIGKPMSVSVYGESVRGSAWYPAGVKRHYGGNGGLPKLGMLN